MSVEGAGLLICPDNPLHQALDLGGIECEIPASGVRERIDAIIFQELVYGRLEETARNCFRAMIGALGARGCDAVILGCTETPLPITEAESPLPVIDSTRTPARGAIREATRIA